MTATPAGREGLIRRRGGDLLVTAPPDGASVPWRALQQELTLFAEATVSDEDELSVPSVRAAELREVLDRPWPAGQWNWTWTSDASMAADRATAVRNAVDRLLLDTEPPNLETFDSDLAASGFSRRLLAAQREAVAQLVEAGGGGNFSVPGSGKTTMAYAMFSLLRKAGRVDRMLVVAPQSAYEAWRVEAEDCFFPAYRPEVAITPRAVTRRADVIVFNYERIATNSVQAAVDAWGQGHRIFVVFDEVHRAKRGSAGLHGRGARDLANLAAVRLVMTGTPMPNGPDDLVAVLDLAWPGQGERLASPLTPRGDRAWVRITKEKLELDAAAITPKLVALDPAHRTIYDALMTDIAADEVAIAKHPALANRAIMRMIACATNPALLGKSDDQQSELEWPEELPDPSDLGRLLENLAGVVQPAKLLFAAQHAARHQREGRKLLVWTNFIGNVDELRRVLAPFGPAVITGSTPLSDPSALTDRERELLKFREDPTCTVLIATPQTLGEGVSLHKVCQSQLHIDRTFNAGLYLQALDRTHRVGMPEQTTAEVTVLVAEGTIDERIDQVLSEKLAAMDQLLNDPTLGRLSKVKPEGAGTRLGATEAGRLLRHLRA